MAPNPRWFNASPCARNATTTRRPCCSTPARPASVAPRVRTPPGQRESALLRGRALLGQVVSPRTLKDARDTLQAALAHAVAEDELIIRNPAGLVKLPAPRSHKARARSVAEACAFLDSARTGLDPLCAAYVLMLVLGLRRGEALGLLRTDVRLDAAELDVAWQLQRSGHQRHHRQIKTGHSDAGPALARHLRDRAQAPGRSPDHLAAGGRFSLARHESGRHHHPRHDVRAAQLQPPLRRPLRHRRGPLHPATRHARTCASLLAALDVHPRVAMRILRHSKIAVTMETYTEIPDQVTRDALRRLGDQLEG
jgi:integrase